MIAATNDLPPSLYTNKHEVAYHINLASSNGFKSTCNPHSFTPFMQTFRAAPLSESEKNLRSKAWAPSTAREPQFKATTTFRTRAEGRASSGLPVCTRTQTTNMGIYHSRILQCTTWARVTRVTSLQQAFIATTHLKECRLRL